MPTSPSIPEVFAKLPWCRPILDDPEFVHFNWGRPRHEGHNPFFYETLTHPRGVGERYYMYRPLNGPQSQSKSSHSDPASLDSPSDSKGGDGGGHAVMESRELMELGPALMGQRGIIHGGFLAVLMDEVAGILIHTYGLGGGLDPFTVTLNTTYKKPVTGPCVVLVKGRVVKQEKRKIWLKSEIVDAQGDVCVQAESFFLKKKGAL